MTLVKSKTSRNGSSSTCVLMGIRTFQEHCQMMKEWQSPRAIRFITALVSEGAKTCQGFSRCRYPLECLLLARSCPRPVRRARKQLRRKPPSARRSCTMIENDPRRLTTSLSNAPAAKCRVAPPNLCLAAISCVAAFVFGRTPSRRVHKPVVRASEHSGQRDAPPRLAAPRRFRSADGRSIHLRPDSNRR
jgi:hypothetical protein